MTKTKSVSLLFYLGLLSLPFFLSACISIKSGNTNNTTSASAFFISTDFAETWTAKNKVANVEAATKTFTNNITKIALDPQDEKAIYLGTTDSGIYYTYNYGSSWENTLPYGGTVNDLFVHPKDKCQIYAAIHNKILKSEDCARTWTDLYFEPRAGQYISSLAINYQNPDIIFAGTKEGALLRSVDKGVSWAVYHRFDNKISKILIMNHSDSNIMYVALESQGVWRSMDGGANWEDVMALPVYQLENVTEDDKTFTRPVITEKEKLMSKISGVKILSDVTADLTTKDNLLYANKIGIFRFTGDHWEQYKLLTSKNKASIYSVTVNPLNGQEIYYGTNNAFYFTKDGGANWQVKDLPTVKIAKELEFSPNSKYLYLGTYVIEQ